MSEIVLFHSVLGLRPGVQEAADRLRAAGHIVHTPDLFGGRVFDDMDEAVEFRDALGGIPELIRRSQMAVEGLPAALVFAGFSMGAAAAEYQTANRPGARAAILMHGALPVEAVGTGWPAKTPVTVHYAVADPWVDADAVDALAGSVREAGSMFEAYMYPGSGHLFADPDVPEYDEASADLLWQRVLDFLRQLDQTDV